MTMNKRLLALTLALSLTFGSVALAQQPWTSPYGSAPAPASQGKADPKAKKSKKIYRGDDFGDIHEGAKKYGVDSSKPESLKGRNVSGEMAKRVKL
jgi:hypothetical protein